MKNRLNKWYSILLVGLVLLGACGTSSTVSQLSPESYTDTPADSEGEQLSSEDEEDEQLLTDTPQEPVEVPLSYVVVESHTERDIRLEEEPLYDGSDMYMTERILYLTVFVTLENTDRISGVFTVNFLVHSYPIGSPKDAIEFIGHEYSESQTIELQPGESGLVQSSACRINLHFNSYSWEFEVIPSTKTIEVQE